jgi:phage terminase large subunit
MIQATTALRKLAGLKNRIWGLQGGQGAGKTYSALILIINHLAGTTGHKAIVASEELTKMRLTVIDDFFKILISAGIYNPWRVRDNGTRYLFGNGSSIKFIGLDKDDIGKGLRSDILYINEGNKITFEAYRQLSSRARRVIIDFNPDLEFWYHTEVMTRPDCSHIVLTYLDNELLSPEERAEIEYYKSQAYHDPTLAVYDYAENIKSEYWANKWRVYGLGQPGALEGVIFKNWRPIATRPPEAKLLAYGHDFGFSSDPAATLALYQWNDKIVLEQISYQTGLTNADQARIWTQQGVSRGHRIWADKAAPQNIKELSGYGFKIAGADKGKDSVNFGIDLLQTYEILLVASGLDLLDEFKKYRWAKDRTGKALGQPVDKDNHLIDAARYAAIMTLKSNRPTYKSKAHESKAKRPAVRGIYEGLL